MAGSDSFGIRRGNAVKSAEQRELLKQAVYHNRLLRLLDDEQIESLVNYMFVTDFDKGKEIVRQGDPGDFFYVIEKGDCEIWRSLRKDAEPTLIAHLSSGDSFGDNAFMLSALRSATVRANTPCRVWRIHKEVFRRNVLPTARTRKLFESYASIFDAATGELAMTPADFLRALNNSPREGDLAVPGTGAAIEAVATTDGGVSAGGASTTDASEATPVPSSPPAAQMAATTADGGRVLTSDDVDADWSELNRLKYLFSVVDAQQVGKLSLADFALFCALVDDEDSEFNIAFMLFDVHKKGSVSLEDVKQVLGPDGALGVNFDFSCNIIRRFFGDKGQHELRFPDFTQFFVILQEEIPRQVFLNADRENSGAIAGEEFVKLLRHFGSWRLPPPLRARIVELGSLRPAHRVVSYAEFVAFNALLNSVDDIRTVVATECRIRGRSSIGYDTFRRIVPYLSPLQVDIAFCLFDRNGDGLIGPRDFDSLLGTRRSLTSHDPSKPHLDPAAQHALTKGLAPAKRTPVTWGAKVKAVALDLLEHFAFGYIAGGIGAAAVYPIDLVKTRMQNQRSVVAADGSTNVLYRNSIHCFRTVIAKEGVRALYRGLLPQLVGVAPEKAVKLTVNDALRSAFDRGTGDIEFPLEVLAGGSAGAAQVMFTNPLEIVKIRMQMQGEVLPDGTAAARKSAAAIVRELGVRGLYKGTAACLMRDIPFSAIYFPVYAASKRVLSEGTGESHELPWWRLLVAGAIGGIPAASLTTPADVIKTRLQVEARQGEVVYRGIADCASKIYHQEGWTAFFKGAGMRVIRSSPQFAVTLAAYEMLSRQVEKFTGREVKSGPPTTIPLFSDDEFVEWKRAVFRHKLLDVDRKLRMWRAWDEN